MHILVVELYALYMYLEFDILILLGILLWFQIKIEYCIYILGYQVPIFGVSFDSRIIGIYIFIDKVHLSKLCYAMLSIKFKKKYIEYQNISKHF